MDLTTYERELLDGVRGEAGRMAMTILYRLGKIYGAKRMIPVTTAHIDGCSYSAVWDAGLEFAERLAELGAKTAVPTTLNITSRDIRNWKGFRIPEDFSDKCARVERAYEKMGCVPTWTCAPYQYGNTPSFGEQVAFAESNVVNYANSVLGARTQRYGDLVDICCAIVGRVPELGLHIKENRAADAVYDVSQVPAAYFRDPEGFAVLGYLVGKDVDDGIPVVDGVPIAGSSREKKENAIVVTHEHLKAFSAASAASGSVGLFHVTGITPEAPTLAAAAQGRPVKRRVEVTEEMLVRTAEAMSAGALDRMPVGALGRGVEQGPSASVPVRVDLVLLGCPHLSYGEARRMLELFGDRKAAGGLEFWIQTSDAVRSLLDRTGLTEQIRRLGIRIMQDSCILNQPAAVWDFHVMVTNSGKMAHYAPGHVGAEVFFRSMDECVEIAVRGEL